MNSSITTNDELTNETKNLNESTTTVRTATTEYLNTDFSNYSLIEKNKQEWRCHCWNSTNGDVVSI